MNEIFYTVIEFDGKHWEHETNINLFKTKEKAEASLAEDFEEAKKDVEENCNNVEVSFSDSSSFEVQGDDYEYWVTGYVQSQIPE